MEWILRTLNTKPHIQLEPIARVSEYTTITVSKELKEELDAGMADGETWNDYLQRLQQGALEPDTAESTQRVSKMDPAELRAVFQDATEEFTSGESRDGSVEPAEIDYDHIREIVRNEIRRALEEILR